MTFNTFTVLISQLTHFTQIAVAGTKVRFNKGHYSTSCSVLAACWINMVMVGLLTINGNAQTPGESDKISIRLFENEPAELLYIKTDSSPLMIRENGVNSTRLAPKESNVKLSVVESTVYLETNDSTYSNEKFALLVNDNNYFIIDHPGLPTRYFPDQLTITTDNGQLKILNTTDFEVYISGVVGAEMNFDEHEALKAQAVIARTYARWLQYQNKNSAYDVLDHTLNQVYKGILPNNPEYEIATRQTSDQILTYNGKPILAAYSSTCGGITSSNKGFWAGSDLPYLKRVADGGACQLSPHFQWTFAAESEKFFQKINDYTDVNWLSVDTGYKDSSGRWKTMYVRKADKEEPQKISGVNFRQIVNAAFGPYALKSMRFSLKNSSNEIIFDGNGMGHGIGLCQWGAKGLARSGWNYAEILKFYYSGVELTDYQNL